MVLSNPKKHRLLLLSLSHRVHLRHFTVHALLLLHRWRCLFEMEASTGSAGSGRNGWIAGGAGGGFWGTATAPSNVGIAIAVTAMAGIALAGTFVYSRR
uniref:Uncharacterized protein n=1 Tax=Salix viminalis TaxID=40686 RepID=A0A6N2M5I7_SALVM